MPNYCVESYLPRARAPELATTAARARRAAETLSKEGRHVRYLRSTFVPEDELCVHVLEAPTVEVARDTARRAAIAYERIVEAIEQLPDAKSKRRRRK